MTLDASITKSEGHAYALGVIEENSTSYQLEFPNDGVVRQAGYAQLMIEHRTKAPGPSVVDVPNIVMQWEIPLG